MATIEGGETSSSPPPAVVSRGRAWTIAEANIPIAITGLLFLALVIRAMTVARGNTISFLVLVRTASVADITVAATPVILAGLYGAASGYLARRDSHFHKLSPMPWGIVAGTWIAAGAALLPWTAFAGVAAVAVVLPIINRWRRRRTSSGPSEITMGRETGVAVGLVILTQTLLSGRPWIAAENIRLSDGDPVVGYVLDSADGDLTVLRHDDRRVVRLPADEIVDREFCETSNASAPLAFLISGSDPDYPNCED